MLLQVCGFKKPFQLLQIGEWEPKGRQKVMPCSRWAMTGAGPECGRDMAGSGQTMDRNWSDTEV